MKSFTKHCLFILLQLLLLQEIFSQGIILNALPVKNGIIEVHNDESFQTIYTSSGLGFTLGSKACSSQIRYDIEIVNDSSEDFFFDINNIALYSGHFDKNNWKRQSFADYDSSTSSSEASEPYEDDSFDNAKLTAAVILIGVITIGTFFLFDYLRDSKDDKNSKDDKKKPDTSSPKPKNPKKEPHYRPIDPHHDLIDDILFFNFIDSLDEDSAYKTSSTLTSKKIKAGESYYGSFYVAATKNPDYKFSYTLSKGEEIELVFVGNESYFKSIATENKSIFVNSEQEDILAFSLGINTAGGFNLYVMGLGKSLSGYFSAGYYFTNYEAESSGSISRHAFHTFEPNWQDSSKSYIFKSSGEYERDVIEFNAGVTFRTLPHIWLLAGCGVDITFKNYYGSIYSRPKNSSQDYTYYSSAFVTDKTPYFVLLPQLGLDLSIGPINFGVMSKYNLREGYMMDLIFGLSF